MPRFSTGPFAPPDPYGTTSTTSIEAAKTLFLAGPGRDSLDALRAGRGPSAG